MEESELRVGGWEKKSGSRWLKRLFTIILIAILGFLIIGPTVINYSPAYVPSSSLYLANGMWNGPFDIDYSKEFAGHVKISSVSYETTHDQSGKLKVITMSSLINLEDFRLQERVIERVKEEANSEGMTLSNGIILNTGVLDNPTGYSIYQWDAFPNSAEHDFYQEAGCYPDFDLIIKCESEIIAKVFVWNQQNTMTLQYQTIICIIFGTNGTIINQATELTEDVI
jgi:hypothetical protein